MNEIITLINNIEKMYLNKFLMNHNVSYNSLNKIQESLLIKFIKKFDNNDDYLYSFYLEILNITEKNYILYKDKIKELTYERVKDYIDKNHKNFIKKFHSIKKREIIYKNISENLQSLSMIDYSFIGCLTDEMNADWLSLVLNELIVAKNKGIENFRYIQGYYKVYTDEQKEYVEKKLKEFEIDKSRFSNLYLKTFREILLQDLNSNQILLIKDLLLENKNLGYKLKYIINLAKYQINLSIIKEFIELDFEKYNIDMDYFHDLLIKNEVDFSKKIKEKLEKYKKVYEIEYNKTKNLLPYK